MVALRSMHTHAENWLTTTTAITILCDAGGTHDYDSDCRNSAGSDVKLIYTEQPLLYCVSCGTTTKLSAFSCLKISNEMLLWSNIAQ